MDNIFNIEALSDNRLSPVDKVIYIGLASKTSENKRSTLTDKQLEKMLQKDNNGQLVQLSSKRIEEGLSRLERLGYIDSKRTILLGKKDELDEEAEKILNYVSEARMVRGYSTRPLKGNTHLTPIRARLRDGRTTEECLAVVNYRFESVWHKQNNKHLVPSTMFRPSVFEKALAAVPDIQEWSQYIITQYGIELDEQEEELVGYM